MVARGIPIPSTFVSVHPKNDAFTIGLFTQHAQTNPSVSVWPVNVHRYHHFILCYPVMVGLPPKSHVMGKVLAHLLCLLR